MKIKSLLLAAALAIPMLASAQTPPGHDHKTPPAKTADDTKTDKPATGDKTKTTAKLSDEEVMMLAHVQHENKMEVDMGKQAKMKGTAAVKRYGEMLMKDHSTSAKEVAALAKKKGLAKIPAHKPQTEVEKEEHKQEMAKMAELKKLKGADFDRMYLQMMVEGHEKELAKTDVFLASAADADVKTMLEARKTSLRRHADAAKELQQGNAQASVTPTAPAKPAK